MDYFTFELLATTSVIVFIVWYFQWHFHRIKLYICSYKLPGPAWFPIFGNALAVLGDSEEMMRYFQYVTSTYLGAARLWLGSRLYVIITKPEDMEIILQSQKAIEKDRVIRLCYPLGGRGLFAAPANIWKAHRKLITPTFNQKILDSFMDIFVEQSKILVQCLDDDVGKEFDISERFARQAMDAICESAMGVKISTQNNESNFDKLIERSLEIEFTRMYKIHLHSDFLYQFSSLSQEEKRINKVLHDFCDKIIQSKRLEYKARKEHMTCEPPAKRCKPFLELLIDLQDDGAKFTDVELRDETMTLIIAGSDTTATMLSFLMISLGLYPQIQDKLLEEIIEIVGPDRSVIKEDLSHFKYMERVIKESLRIFAVAPVILRELSDELPLSNGVVLPKSCGLVLALFKVHFDERHWPNPWKFDPDRFLSDANAVRHPFAYIPFSAGPRNCIGPRYAMMSMKVTLATMLRKYRVFTDYSCLQDVKYKQDLIIKPVDGYKIRIERR